jgi:two-component system, NarL family, sensor histidine kinase UhpB
MLTMRAVWEPCVHARPAASRTLAVAGVADLSLEQDQGEVTLRVRDDGRGLPPEALKSATGIRGMRERAMLIGAQLSIIGPEAGGTELVLRVPLGER